jgi:hypothetical protein
LSTGVRSTLARSTGVRSGPDTTTTRETRCSRETRSQHAALVRLQSGGGHLAHAISVGSHQERLIATDQPIDEPTLRRILLASRTRNVLGLKFTPSKRTSSA